MFWHKAWIPLHCNQLKQLCYGNKQHFGVLDRMIEDEAWQNLSSSYPFSAELLEKYKDRLDWHKVSGNSNICWTVVMLEKFRKLID